MEEHSKTSLAVPSPTAATVPTEIAGVGGGASPAVIAKRAASWAVGAVLRRKLAMAAGCLASVVAAVGLSAFLAKKTWEASGTMLYTPLTTAESQASMYVPPDLKTLVSIAKEPAALGTICKEFGLEIPVKALASSFEVVAPNGVKTIEIKLKWADGKAGADMINRLMELFRQSVLDIRLRKIDDYARGCELNDKRASDRYLATLKAMQDFNLAADCVDLGREIGLLNDGLVDLQTELGRARRAELNYTTQAKELEKVIAEMRNKEKVEGEADKQFEAADETISDNRRRQDRLREMVTDERLRLETEALLVAKRAELRRLARLGGRDFASKEEIEKVTAEIGVLTAKIADNEKIAGWKQELERIDQVVVPKGKSKSQGSPIVAQALTKRLEIDLLLRGNREERREIEEEIGDRRERIKTLLTLQLKHHSLEKDVESAELERQAASAALRDMRKLQAMRVPDLVVVTPATPSPSPASNRKTLLLGLLAVGLLLTASTLLALDAATSTGPPAASVASALGLAILGRVEGPKHDPASLLAAEWSEGVEFRLLALRLRQAIRSSSGLCLFSSLNESAGSSWLVVPLARCLARRDERVLILDAGGNEADRDCLAALVDAPAESGESVGLSGYLTFAEDDPERVVRPTTIPAVDCLPRGDEPVGVDTLATYRMSELIDALRERYTMILLVGPRADHQVDLEILSSRADGVLFLGDDGAGRCLKSPPSVRVLARLGAPILGAVVGVAARAGSGWTGLPRGTLRRRLDKSRS